MNSLELLRSRLSDVPDQIVQKLQSGFRNLAAIPENLRTERIRKVLTRLAEGAPPSREDVKSISEEASLSTTNAGDALMAISMTFGALVDLDVSVQDFITVARGRFFDDKGALQAEQVAQEVVNNRSTLKRAYDRASLGNSILPSLEYFDFEIDMRMRFADGELTGSAPVVVVHISTDVEGEDLWFQMNKGDIKQAIERLTKVVADLDLAEKVVRAGRVGLGSANG